MLLLINSNLPLSYFPYYQVAIHTPITYPHNTYTLNQKHLMGIYSILETTNTKGYTFSSRCFKDHTQVYKPLFYHHTHFVTRMRSNSTRFQDIFVQLVCLPWWRLFMNRLRCQWFLLQQDWCYVGFLPWSHLKIFIG